MAFSRQDRPGQAVNRLRETGLGICFGLSLAVHPARAAGDTLGATDTLPPSGTHIAIYVADSATGAPLAGASVTLQDAAANIGIATADARGWAYIPRSGLPADYHSEPLWTSAGNPGYLSRLQTLSGCGSDIQPPCMLRFALARATEKNSLTFAGTLLDTAGEPIARLPIDVSAQVAAGWLTFLSTTDENGRFVFKDIPNGLGTGFLFVRSSPSRFEMLSVHWSDSGDSIIVPHWSATSLAPSRARPRVAAPGKSAPFFLFRSGERDAAGRRRD